MTVEAGTTALRQRLRTPDPSFGAWLQMDGSIAAEQIGGAGFDWIGIDRQHGLIDFRAMVSMLQAIAISRTPTLVRVADSGAAEIGRTLDAGAHGVIVPMVETVDEVAAAVSACQYGPVGRRSWGPIRPAIERPGLLPTDELLRPVCVALVETVRGVEAVESLVTVPGLDAVMIGPSDLMVSMGGSPHVSLVDDGLRTAVERVAGAARGAGLGFGALAPTPALAPDYAAAGCTFLAVHRDIQSMLRAAEEALTLARSASGS